MTDAELAAAVELIKAQMALIETLMIEVRSELNQIEQLLIGQLDLEFGAP